MIKSAPEFGFLRAKHILGNPKAVPPILPIIPVSPSTWWDGVKSGKYPKPIRHGGASFWKISSIRKLAEQIEAGETA